jgi:hypothetical protein
MLYKDVKSTGKPLHRNHLGGNRDSDEGKLDYTLVPVESMDRLVRHYMNGLKKYGRDNWKKLSLPEDIKRYEQSMYRHLMQYLAGFHDEDHLAAVAWNAMCLMYFQEVKSPYEVLIDIMKQFIEKSSKKQANRFFHNLI